MFYFTAEKPDFWIQTKGENAGRPLRQPCTNSVGVKADRAVFVPQFLYYCFQHLYNTGIYNGYLRGSVIPYIRNGDILEAFVKCYSNTIR